MWQQSENGRVTHPFEPAILAATLALIPVLIIERDVSSGAWVTVAKVANWAIWGNFILAVIGFITVARWAWAWNVRSARRMHERDVQKVLDSNPDLKAADDAWKRSQERRNSGQ
jgi:hypothetical protein